MGKSKRRNSYGAGSAKKQRRGRKSNKDNFLAQNKNKKGVVSLPSGLQYKVLREGTGKFHPKKNSPCLCHYEGKLTNGKVFDSSYRRGRPTDFAPNQVISGWTEAMQLMVEGDKWEMYIPSRLGYGPRGSPPDVRRELSPRLAQQIQYIVIWMLGSCHASELGR